ncbi:MAG TPA: gas vesicle protein GvpG [Candidatus Limnocylindria bacterium]|nr:gas vesicle protein GvpG [Candidatus Limnocylindria bacterium]
MFGLGKLLTLPYSLPAAGIKYCINKVVEMAEQEMTDETPVKEELQLLNMRYDDGEIDEAEFRRLEAPLVARFSAIRAYRKQLAEEQLGGLLAETLTERVAIIETPLELEPPA